VRRTFVVDENIVMCATKRENIKEVSDLVCYRLIDQVLEKHRLAYSQAVWEKWQKQVNMIHREGRAIHPHFLVLLNSAIRDPDRCPRYDPDPLSEEIIWSTKLLDDKDFIRLAAHIDDGCLLATTDENLERDVVAHNLGEKYGFRVLLPDLALKCSRET